MSRKSNQKRGARFGVEPELLDALESIHGPLNAPKTRHRIAHGLEKIEKAIRRERGKALPRKYLRDPDILLAYGTHDLCRQSAKLAAIFHRIGDLPELGRPMRILELGCGPGIGVASLGILARAKGIDIHHFATDGAPEMLSLVVELAKALDLPNVMPVKVDLARPVGRQLDDPDRFDLILCTNVVSSMAADRQNLLIKEFGRWLTTEGSVIVLDSAHETKNRHLLEFRDRCVQAEWQILAPCPHQLPCPALEIEQETCHDHFIFEEPEFMTDMGTKRAARPPATQATWFVIGREHRIKISENRARIVGERTKEKGRIHARICGENGLTDLELQNRDRTDSNSDLGRANRYDLMEVIEVESIGHRLRITRASRCEIVEEDGLLRVDTERGSNEP